MSEPHAANVVELIRSILDRAASQRATDVHFEPLDTALLVRFRVDGVLREADRLPAPLLPNIVARLKVLSGLLTYRTDIPQEGSFSHNHAGGVCDVRAATFPTIRGERIVLRLLPAGYKCAALNDLGHAPETLSRLRAFCNMADGMLIVCGPVGSGKTTTLRALLDEIARLRPHASIFAVEDPVEMRIDGVTQVQVEPDRGLTYAVALRSLLRQDPQVLMVGEIRDAETARIAFDAAMTGHLLLTTLHSGRAVDAIIRLREMGIAPYQLTSALRSILSQRLLRLRCPQCTPDAADSACPTCGGAGYAGRTAIGQMLEMSESLRTAILEGGDSERLRCASGCAALRLDAERLLAAGRTTRHEIDRVLGAE